MEVRDEATGARSVQQEDHSVAGPAQATAVATSSAIAADMIEVDILDSLQCAICLELLHKPCVNTCGHAFCFWCFHHAMNGLSKSHCPLCRAEFKHFSAVCLPLHSYITAKYPSQAAARDAQTMEQEHNEFHAESPSLPIAPLSVTAQTFACAGCGALAAPPAVLTCGHVVCARVGERWHRCPVQGCVGRDPADGTLAVCTLMESIIEAQFSPDYQQALRRPERCAALLQAADEEPSQSQTAAADDGEEEEDPTSMIGSQVKLHSLSSAAGLELNGQLGAIEGYDPVAGRFEVILSSSSRRVRVRPTNVQRQGGGSSETYTHFGRGCDGCGVFPIVGRCYRCQDCSEAIGYDLCGRCFDIGFHRRPAAVEGGGRFNQAHLPEHRMTEVKQEETVLHTLQRQHPELTPDQIIALLEHAQR